MATIGSVINLTNFASILKKSTKKNNIVADSKYPIAATPTNNINLYATLSITLNVNFLLNKKLTIVPNKYPEALAN
jgi:hypothetical protein